MVPVKHMQDETVHHASKLTVYLKGLRLSDYTVQKAIKFYHRSHVWITKTYQKTNQPPATPLCGCLLKFLGISASQKRL